MKHRRVCFLFGMTVSSAALAAGWMEVCAPGRSDDELSGTASANNPQGIEALTPFDGRLYVTLSRAPKGTAMPIVSFAPQTLDVHAEVPAAGIRFGRMRVLENRLYAPMIEPAGDAGGYYLSAGGGKWEWVAVTQPACAFYDVARFDRKTILAGEQGNGAIVAWRADNSETWHVESLTSQVARLSYMAASFIGVSNHLGLLAVRDAPGVWPHGFAPREWGSWYVLSYTGGGLPRGFMFDGPARPLPALRMLAPDASLADNPKIRVMRDVAWQDGLLALLLSSVDLRPDPKGGLLHIRLRKGAPQTWDPVFVGSRIADMENARDVAVADGLCAVLLVEEGFSPKVCVLVSGDLETWQTRFNEELPVSPQALALFNNEIYLGLDDGRIVKVKK